MKHHRSNGFEPWIAYLLFSLGITNQWSDGNGRKIPTEQNIKLFLLSKWIGALKGKCFQLFKVL